VDVGIGLPSTIPHIEGPEIVEWARRAEGEGFPSLGVIDRLVYPNYDPLVALAAAAAVTARARLVTAVLLTPYRNTAVMAKQVASIDRLSGGRVVLGVGLGGRPEDYAAAGMETKGRGRRMSAQLEEMRSIWAGERRGFAGGIGPEPVRKGGPVLMGGGSSEPAIERTIRFCDGWMQGGGGPAAFKTMAEKVRAAWQQAGRIGQPKLMALSYFGLGAEGSRAIDAFLRDYYAIAGERAEQVAQSALTTPERIREAVAAYQDAGCDEVILFPGSADPAQVDELRHALA
jgi:alkanesulfonate monooxygenase SsuD/methylene tetrahydromethanopterin reductase-like flavin-dependent oxidoreductase (luciferase family)